MKGEFQKRESQTEGVSNSEYKLCPRLWLTPGPRTHQVLSNQPNEGWKNKLRLEATTQETEFTVEVQSGKLPAKTNKQKNQYSSDEYNRI